MKMITDFFPIAVLALAQCLPAATLVVDVPPGGLDWARGRLAELVAARPTEDIVLRLAKGRHRLQAPLRLGREHSGEPGRFRVIWAGNDTVFDGGVDVHGPWTPAQAELSTAGGYTIFSAPIPHALRGHPVRQLYVDGVRLRRTVTSAAALGLPRGAQLTPTGFKLESVLPLRWKSSSVELVSDHTWVQHRCPVTAVTRLPLPPPPAPAPHPTPPPVTCRWSNRTAGE